MFIWDINKKFNVFEELLYSKTFKDKIKWCYIFESFRQSSNERNLEIEYLSVILTDVTSNIIDKK